MPDPALRHVLRRAAALAFVDDIDAPAVGPRDAHHLGRVLRIRPDESVVASDGVGGWRPCRWSGDGLEPTGEIVRQPRPDVLVTVAFAVPKGDRADWAVQKLTEAGADRIVPLMAERSTVRWTGERAGKTLERWRAIVREAAMQARRVWLPVVAAPLTPAAALDEFGPGALAEPGGSPPSLRRPTVLVGPEGGWTASELDGAHTVDLGPTVLRTETAAVVAAGLMNALRAGILREA